MRPQEVSRGEGLETRGRGQVAAGEGGRGLLEPGGRSLGGVTWVGQRARSGWGLAAVPGVPLTQLVAAAQACCCSSP